MMRDHQYRIDSLVIGRIKRVKFSLHIAAAGAALRHRIRIVRSLAALAVCALAFVPSAVKADSADHIISRGYGPGMYSFTCYHNLLSGTSLINFLQVVQGPFNVTSAITTADVSYSVDPDGCVVGHIIKNGYLNNMLAYPVRITVDVRMVNAMYKAGTFRWKVTTLSTAAVQRTWMDTSRIYGNVQGYINGYFKADVQPFPVVSQ
jgi:hypothetical protein